MKNITIDGKDLVQESGNQVEHLRNQVKQHAATIKKLQAALGSQSEFAEACCAATVAAEPFKPFAFRKSGKTATPIVAVAKFSDWHIGEYVNSREVEGFNRYDYEIACQRIFGIARDFLDWVDVMRSAYRIDRCVIMGLGDYVSGDIHPELLATNEFPLPEQTARAGLLLGEVFRIICGRFKEVEALLVGADNHGRLQKKPQAKQKSNNNMSYLVHTLAMSHAERCGNLKPFVATGAKLLHSINGKKFLMEHGDNIRGQMGIPYYGFARLVGKEATRRMNTPRGFDYLSIGHFHVPAIIDGRIYVNGSLSGTTEFDHGQGRHAAPSQVAFLVHPKHGIFNWVPFQG